MSAEVKNEWNYTYRAPYTFITCRDKLQLYINKKYGKVKTRVEITEKVRPEKKRKKYLNRRKEKQNRENNKKWTIKLHEKETARRKN
jgi:hypothetical protein